jgi:ribosome biogenesis GTPase
LPQFASLRSLGWTAELQTALDAVTRTQNPLRFEAARVSEEHRTSYRIVTGGDDLVAEASGRLRHLATSPLDLPVVGDFVAVSTRPSERSATIHAVLPRRGVLVRKAAGTRTLPQAMAANVDTCLLVTSCNQDLSPRRLERAMVLAWDAGATPVLLLNKADLVDDADALARELGTALPGAEVHAVSAVDGRGLDALAPHLAPTKTLVLLGSSGVGKSTLANLLLGEQRLSTQSIRADDAKGRHTTTSRHLVRLPGGAFLIDTPGTRELALWGDGESTASAFSEIDEFATQCHFADCIHEGEPGCAVQVAIDKGDIDPDRLGSRKKLDREMARLAAKQDQGARLAERRKNRAMGKIYRDAQNERRRRRGSV